MHYCKTLLDVIRRWDLVRHVLVWSSFAGSSAASLFSLSAMPEVAVVHE